MPISSPSLVAYMSVALALSLPFLPCTLFNYICISINVFLHPLSCSGGLDTGLVMRWRGERGLMRMGMAGLISLGSQSGELKLIDERKT